MCVCGEGGVQYIKGSYTHDFGLCTCVLGSLEEPVSYEGLFDVLLRALLHLDQWSDCE